MKGATRTPALLVAGACLMWGLFPLYFRALQHVPASQILAHRLVWSFVVLAAIAGVWRGRRALPDTSMGKHTWALLAGSAIAISVNWLTYIWTVNEGRVVDASLGYFVTPLVSVLLGVCVLRERLRAAQWASVALAAAGVGWLSWQAGHPPWPALIISASFGLYGLLRKSAPVDALTGMCIETLFLLPIALAYLAWWAPPLAPSTTTLPLLLAAGPLTAVSMLMFTAGARALPLSTVGLLQYLCPIVQLLCGLWLYDEPFGGPKLLGYLFVWAGLAVYSLDSMLTGPQPQIAKAAPGR